MKSHINLVAREILFEEKPFPFKQMAAPVAAAAVVVLLTVVSLGYFWQATMLKKEVRQLSIQRDKAREELARLNGEIGGLVKETEISQESAAQQLAAMKDLIKTRIPWSDIVREVSFIVPEGVWLTRMETDDSKQGGFLLSGTEPAIRFAGLARSQAAVNQFISALERSPRYGVVTLIYTQKGSGGGETGMSFELTAGLR